MKIYSKLLTSLLSTALVPLLCVALIVYAGSRATLLGAARENLRFHATTLGNGIGAMLETSFDEVDSWSRLETLQAVFTGDDIDLRMGLLLRDLQETSGFLQIWCVDTTGKIVASSDFEQVGDFVSNNPAVEAALNGDSYVSEVHESSGAGDASTLAMAISYPIEAAFDEETIIGAVIAFYDWGNVVDVVGHQTVTHDPARQEVMLLGEQGMVLAASNRDAILKWKVTPRPEAESPLTFESTEVSPVLRDAGPKMVTGLSIVDIPQMGIHYTAIAAVEEGAVLQWLGTLGAIVLLSSLFAVLGVVLVSIALTRTISFPIIRLSKAAKLIAAGDLDISVDHSSSDEIGTLAVDIDAMRTNLKSHIETLDTTVEKRTQELEDTIERLRQEIQERMEAERQTKVHQQQLVQADKMVSLGILVSGVAHEINNPNAVIGLNLAVIAEAWLKALPVLEEYYQDQGDFSLGAMNYSEMRSHIPILLDETNVASDRIMTIVQDLKAFSTKGTEEVPTDVDLNAVVRSAKGLVAKHLEDSTKHFSVDYAPDLPPVQGVFHKLEQVIVNLLLNAGEALENMEQTVSVSTTFDAENGTVQVTVRDEGCGIDSENLAHITDPFFTTKRASGGTGLGLSVSSRIVEEHNGSLTFHSRTSGGTTAILSLPVRVNSETLKS